MFLSKHIIIRTEAGRKPPEAKALDLIPPSQFDSLPPFRG